jgi:thioester reductase-like protein
VEGAPRAVLLTGATGFLGAFLLHELLRATDAEVHCQVRAADRDGAAGRLRGSLEAYGLWDERHAARIVALPGDLGQPLLGLSPAAFQALAERVDRIYHNGALVNFMYPYALLRAANVLGTQEVLRLACQGRPKPVHLVSTVGALGMSAPPDGELTEDDRLPLRQLVESGYVQSKWVAEKLALAARERGLPVSIYRVTRIWGHSATGAGNPDDFLFRLLKGCVQLGCAPDLSFQANLVPADYVARALVHLSGLPEAAGRAFHLANASPTEFGALVDQARGYGYALRTLPYAEWRAQLVAHAAESPGHALHTLLDFFPEQLEDAGWLSFLGDSPIDSRQARGLLAGSGISCPPIDSAIMRAQLAAAVRRSHLEPPRPPRADSVSRLPFTPTL